MTTATRRSKTGGRSSAPSRIVIEHISPEIDGGRFPAKEIAPAEVRVEADVFGDGHDVIACRLRFRHIGKSDWDFSPMARLGNDRFAGEFPTTTPGRYEFEIDGRVDHYRSWLAAFAADRGAGRELGDDRAVGAAALKDAARRAGGAERSLLRQRAKELLDDDIATEGLDLEDLAGLVDATVRPSEWTASPRRAVQVDRPLARASSWYELFPRSAGEAGRHGTFADVERRLDYVDALGFDVLYLPPIHPIGTTNRKGFKGRAAGPDDPGSPWAIGSDEGGHRVVHPELGTLADFDRLVEAAERRGIEIALDYALQCSPDHPWVTEHPDWFRHRPDGSIACAENPPKRYEDVYPLDFDSRDWQSLWEACLGILEHWIGHGVRVFRVDNPHTKPFAFWEWLLDRVAGIDPGVLFLSEAFTRPRVMEELAKLGFAQSYTYFTWRRTKDELASYTTELTTPPVSEFLRPNAWPNTPDILVEPLARGRPAAFALRAVLAATLYTSWGIYGPCFELCENETRDDAEEYLHSDKYEIRWYPFDLDAGVAPLISRLNEIRRDNAAFASVEVTFHETDNPALLAYSKVPTTGPGCAVLVVANLDPDHRQSGWVTPGRRALGIGDGAPLVLEDLLSGESFTWEPGANFVILDPARAPAHVCAVAGGR